MKNKNNSQSGKKLMKNIEENLPSDLYTQASVALMNALTLGQFEELESMLHEDVRTVCCGSRTLYGKTETLEYWKEWRQRYVETSIVEGFEVVHNNYYAHACLKIDNTLVLFQVGGDLISTIILTAVKSSEYANDSKLNYPLDIERIKQYLEPLPKIGSDGSPIDTANQIPCLQCGLESVGLHWFKSTIPSGNSFSFRKNWHAGLVSVCPKCGHIVEYKYLKTVDYDIVKFQYVGPQYPDNGNEFSAMADRIYCKKKFESLHEGQTEPFVNHLFSQLTDVALEPNFKLALKLYEKKGSGDISRLCVSGRNGIEELDICKHLRVKQTKMAAWQLYLLNNISTVLPLYWHGGYIRRNFIFRALDIDGIFPLKFHDLSELSRENAFVPSVEIAEENAHGCTMVVRCCYWNDWEGLVRESSGITIENGKLKNISHLSKKVEFQYNCGILF